MNRVDFSEFERKAAQAVRTEAARRRYVSSLAEGVVRRQLVLAADHRDTGRYMRATAQAGNTAGIGIFPSPPVGPSQMQERMIEILARQVRRWAYWKALYKREGRTSEPYYRKIEKNLKKAKEELEKFEKNANMGAIVIGAFQSTRLVTVRVNFKAYGGIGRVITAGGETVVELRNLEPHASIVESRFGITRKALRQTDGARKIGRAVYAQHLKKAGFAAA